MTKQILPAIILFISLQTIAQPKHEYKVVGTYHIASAGGWDYLAVHDQKLYVSHGGQVNILNEQTGDSIAFIPNTTGVHGIAFNPALNQGYTSNGRLNNISVFDLTTNVVSGQIATGENPDAILYEPVSKMIITCNGRSNDLSVIDPVSQKLVATIPVGGKPETAVADDKGQLFVNIEDKNEIVAVDLASYTVLNHWSLKGAEGPTGLVMDRTTRRLFSTCDKKLVVMNADNGNIVTTLPIGDGCDGAAFNAATKTIYTSNGEGTMTVITENPADKFTVLGNYKTKRGARTITLDEKTTTLFLSTADFDPVAKSPNGRPVMVPGSFQVLVVR